MHLIFFDEAKHDTNHSHYYIGAASIEFHPAKIYQRKGNFKDWTEFNRRVELIGKRKSPSAAQLQRWATIGRKRVA